MEGKKFVLNKRFTKTFLREEFAAIPMKIINSAELFLSCCNCAEKYSRIAPILQAKRHLFANKYN
jgi:hypothetical protein